MQKLMSLFLFIRKHKLLKYKSYGWLMYSARKQGYTVREWQRNKSLDEQLLELLKCRELSHYKDAFTYMDEYKRLIFIARSLPEYEKKILLTHELIHIHLGHLCSGERITVTQENDTTEFAHNLKILLSFICFFKYALLLCAVITFATLCIQSCF